MSNKKLYAFYGILVPVENEQEGNNTLFKIDKILMDNFYGESEVYLTMGLPIIGDFDKWKNKYEELMKLEI